MVDAQELRAIFSVQNAAWTAVTLLLLFVWRMWNGAPAMFAQWIDYRRAKAEERSADWNRFREEIKYLRDAERQCRSDYDELYRRSHLRDEEIAELRKELGELRGYMAGQGRAAQEAAGIVAIERQEQQRLNDK